VDGKSSIELANLNREGIIDGVITNDSNALVFGASCVIRWYALLTSLGLVNRLTRKLKDSRQESLL